MAAPAGPVRKHTARGTEPGLQAPWHLFRSSYAVITWRGAAVIVPPSSIASM